MKYVEDYLASCKLCNSRATFEAYTRWLHRFAKWRAQNPGELTRAYHNQYFHAMIERGCSRATVQLALSVQRSFYEWCIEQGTMDANPIGKFKLPPYVYREKPIFSEEEFDKLVALARTKPSSYWADALTVSWHTGLRLGDVANLHWMMVCMEEKTITLTPRKTARWGKHLVIPIAPELDEVFTRLHEIKSRPSGIEMLPPKVPVKHWVFPQMHASYAYHTHDKLSHWFIDLAREAGCRHTSIHGFRRTFVSRMVNSGVNPAVICQLTGHSLDQVMGYVKTDITSKRQAIMQADSRREINESFVQLPQLK